MFNSFHIGGGDNQLWCHDAFDGSFKLRAVFSYFSYHFAQSLAEETSHVHPLFAGLLKKKKENQYSPQTHRDRQALTWLAPHFPRKKVFCTSVNVV